MPNQNRNAIELLKGDHREVESLFAQLKSESSGERQLELGRAICVGLMVHAQIEEELFYPAARKALPAQGKDLVAEATVEHASLKRLIADIDGSASGDELFDARFKVLEEYVWHHVEVAGAENGGHEGIRTQTRADDPRARRAGLTSATRTQTGLRPRSTR